MCNTLLSLSNNLSIGHLDLFLLKAKQYVSEFLFSVRIIV